MEFVKLLHSEITPSIVVVGENFHFGKDRKGTAKALKEIAHDYFDVEILSKIKDEGTISSTRIRELLLLGNINTANRLLGREYAISGKVVRGKGKGIKLGFPTINIKINKEKLMPLDGVYKVKVTFNGQEYWGAMFCGHGSVEVYIINFKGDLYQKEVVVKILERIRDIKEFSNDSALKSAIAKDVEKINTNNQKIHF